MEEHQLQTSWKGFLSFKFVVANGRTVLKDKKHFGPLVIQRPYYQEVDLPIVLVLHPPGGIAGGDDLQIDVEVTSDAKGMVSTPAATKFYRSNQRLATQTQRITMAPDSQLEWLPQETLFFDRSVVENKLTFDLIDESAKLIAWDIVGLGRPESGEDYRHAELKQTLQVNIAGRCLFLDKLHLAQNSELLDSPAGFNQSRLFATALFYSSGHESLKALLECLQLQSWFGLVGVTRVSEDLLVMRVLSSSLDDMKDDLFKAWRMARPLILGREALKPRIWNT